MERETQEEIDDEPEDCDCIHADYDLLEGRAHCPMCGRNWYLTGDELKSELQYQAEAGDIIADEQKVKSDV